MTWYPIFVGFVAGVYFIFLVMSQVVGRLHRKHPLLWPQFLICLFSLVYCLVTNWVTLTPFSEFQLSMATTILFFCGNFSFVIYIYAVQQYFENEYKPLRWIQHVLILIGGAGVLFQFIPVLTGDITLNYMPAEGVSPNLIIQSYLGMWQVKPIPSGLIMALAGVTVLIGNVYMIWILFFKERPEPLLIVGCIISMITNINDLIFGSGFFAHLVPLAFLGYLFEALRFHLSVSRESYERARDLEREIFQMAKLSEVGRVAAQMGHDLRNGLTRIGEMIPDTDEARGCMKSMEQIVALYTDRMLRKDSAQSQKTTIAEVFNMTADSLKDVFEKKSCKFKLISGAEEAIPIGKSEALVVFTNIILNALDAIEDSSQADRWIQIEAIESKQNEVIVLVSDNGPGIPKSSRDHLFDSQFSTKPEGLGIGLSIVREILMENRALINLKKASEPTQFEIIFHR